jgi:hypothetical protein
MADDTVEDLRDKLVRQLLELAVKSDNPQFKVDVYKATENRGRLAKPADNPGKSSGAFAAFHDRVRRAEQGMNGDGEPVETDQ